MAATPNEDDPEVEIICPTCFYRLRRTADRLRRETEILCPNCGAVVVPAAPESGPAADP